MIRPALLALVGSLWTVAAQPTATGSLHGRVEFDGAINGPVRRPETHELGSSRPTAPHERRRSVVYLDVANASPAPAPARATMDQHQEAFVPRVLAIPVGSVVDFPNSDPTYHNVFSLSRAKRFDLGRYAAGRSKSIRFDQPGIVRVFCDIHSHMSAFILVFGHRYFAVSDRDGRFRIDDVPAGTYALNVWTEVLPVRSRPIVVPAHEETEVVIRLSQERDK